MDTLKPESETVEWVTATETLWLTVDRDRLVVDGDPEAAFLFTTPGKRISLDDARQYGLLKGKPEKAEVVAAPEKVEAKADAKPEPAKPAPTKPAASKRGKAESK